MEIRPERLAFILKYITIDFVVVSAICGLMIIVFKWVSERKSPLINISFIIVFSMISPALFFLLSNTIKYIIWPEGIEKKISFEGIRSVSYYHVMFFITLCGILYITRFRNNFIRQKEAALKAESLVKDTQLKMLRYQINPHFLFNILNSLHALIDENKDLAKKLIIDLSEYYRFTLDKQLQKHSIENEISIIKKFLEIQKVRFEEDIEYEISVDERAETIQIPAFIIHLLIENAVKYGLKCFEKKLIIKLNVTMVNNNLSIIVANSGNIIETNKKDNDPIAGTGNGIDNIVNRLKLLFEDNFTFSLKEENNWVIARIDIHNNML